MASKNDGALVIGTKIDDTTVEIDLKKVEKKIENSKVDEKLTQKFENATKKAENEITNVEEKIEELQGKINFLSKQKAISSFQQKQLEDFKKELEELTSTTSQTETAIENINEVEAFENVEETTENLKEVQNEIKTTETAIKNLDATSQKERKIKLQAEFDVIQQQLEDIDSQIAKLKDKYKNQKIMVGDVEVFGVDAFSNFATDEELKQANELDTKYRELQKTQGEILHEMSQVSQEIYKQGDEVGQQVIKQDENLQKITELQIKLEEMIASYKEMEKQEIFSDSDMQFMKDLRKEITATANELGRLQGSAVHIKGITDNIKPTNFVNIKNITKSIGKETTNIVKKVAKWGLAVFGVRQAYMFIRQSVSTLSQYNEQLAADLEYIRFAIATAFEKAIQNIIQLVYRLLYYVNYIAQAWFGINLFAGATVDKFNSANKSLKSAGKSAKELQKTIAGFDEMNILQKDGSTDVGGGGGGIKAPTVDLSAWQDVKIPKWIEWIAKNKDLIIAALAGIAAGLIALKLGAGGLLALGIGTAVYGLILLILDIVKFIQDPSWSNFANILADLAIVISAVAIAMIAFNATNPVGWIVLAVAAVVALIAVFIKLAEKLGSNKAQILDTKKAQEQLTEAQNKAKEATDNYVSAIDRAEEAERKLKEAEEKHQLSGEALYNAVQNGTLDYKNMNEAQREVYKAYLNNKQAQEDLEVATKDLSKAKKAETKASIENELAIGKEKGNYDKLKESVVKAYSEGKIKAGEARNYIERAMGGMSEASKKTFAEDLPNDIKKGLDPDKYMSAWDKFKRGWNNFWNGLKTKLNMNIDASYSSSGGKKSAKGAIIYPSMPLAVGGIVNQPGRGVPIGGAITGERGAEGVIPLTDSQQMQLLGEAIGKYVTVNLTNVNQMNGRVLSREIKKIESENDFAFNR